MALLPGRSLARCMALRFWSFQKDINDLDERLVRSPDHYDHRFWFKAPWEDYREVHPEHRYSSTRNSVTGSMSGRASNVAPCGSCMSLRPLVVDLNNRPFKKLPGCRHSLFEQLDRPMLKALPSTACEYVDVPRAHQAIADWSAARFEQWASDIDPATLRVLGHQLNRKSHQEQSYRSVLALLSLDQTL